MIHWVAEYDDGSELVQFPGDGRENPYSAIDRSKLSAFSLHDENGLFYRLHLELGQQLFWRRRVWQQVGGAREEILIVGWSRGNEMSVVFIFPDGHLESRSSWAEGHEWADPIVPMPCEIEQSALVA